MIDLTLNIHESIMQTIIVLIGTLGTINDTTFSEDERETERERKTEINRIVAKA